MISLKARVAALGHQLVGYPGLHEHSDADGAEYTELVGLISLGATHADGNAILLRARREKLTVEQVRALFDSDPTPRLAPRPALRLVKGGAT
jgi:hypothetical protein